MKYIILEDGTSEIFPKYRIHSNQAGGRKVVSAGFWDGEKASGESTTLGVKSRPEDTEILTKHHGK